MKFFISVLILVFSINVLADGISNKCLQVYDSVSGQSAGDEPILLLNARLIRPSIETESDFILKEEAGSFGHLVLKNDEIFAVFDQSQECELSEFNKLSAKVFDLKGKYIIPGLHDLHIHNYGMNSDIPNSPIFSKDGSAVEHIDFPGLEAMNYRMAYSGVTTYLDLNSYNEDTKAFRDRQRGIIDGSIKRPKNYTPSSNIYMTGGIFVLEGSHHGDLNWLVGEEKPTVVKLLKSETVAQENTILRRKYLTQILKKHINHYEPTALKISYDHNPNRPGSPDLFNFDLKTLTDYVSVAKEIDPNIKVICHVGIWKDLVECMDAGADAATHLPYSKSNDPAYKIPDGIFKRMKMENFTVIPTMTVYMEGGFIKDSLFDLKVEKKSCEEGEEGCKCSNLICTKLSEEGSVNGNIHFFEDPLLKEVTPKRLRDHYFDFNFYAGNPWMQWGVDHNELGYRQSTFKQMMDADVAILSGTDTMWEATFFGFSLHRELELMSLSNSAVEVPIKPISNMDILATSTSKVHDFLNHYRGRIEAGFKADLVVLNSSPIQSILNTRDINKVFLNGELIDREALRREKMGVL